MLQFTTKPKTPPAPTAAVTDPGTAGPPEQATAPTTVPSRARRKRLPMIEADRLFNKPWCIEEKYLKAMKDSRAEQLAIIVAYDPYDDDEDDQQDEPDYPITDDGIAMISVTGPLTKGMYWRGTAYGEVMDWAKHAYTNPNVLAILFIYDSPGGEVASDLIDTCNFLYQMRETKPTAAVSSDACYSAAYWLGSTAPKLFVTQVGGTGAIGIWQMHVCVQKALEQEGVEVKLIHAGAKKVQGNQFEPLSDEAEADMQNECNSIRDMFVSAVARNRACSADALYETEAGCVMAEKGIPLLADAVGSVDDALGYLRGRVATLKATQSGADPLAAGRQEDDNEEDLLASSVVIDGQAVTVGTGSIVDITSLTINGTVIPAGTFSIVQKPAEPKTEVVLSAEQFCGKPLSELMTLAAVAGRADIGKNGVGTSVDSTEQFVAIRGYKANLGAAETDRTITCCVAPYNVVSRDLGGFVEIYQPGCFAEGLVAGDDCRALFAHDDRTVLGRRSAGTATFYEQADGLYFRCEAPNTQWADDLLVSMRRKDITGGSAAFFILQPRWEMRGGVKTRIIEKAKLVETSIASFPFYESSQATVASAATAAAASAETSEVIDFAEIDSMEFELLRLR